MKKNIMIVALMCLCVWFGNRVVVLENYRYAAQLNMCSEYATDLFEREKCLQETETRAHWMWHLLYGLKIL